MQQKLLGFLGCQGGDAPQLLTFLGFQIPQGLVSTVHRTLALIQLPLTLLDLVKAAVNARLTPAQPLFLPTGLLALLFPLLRGLVLQMNDLVLRLQDQCRRLRLCLGQELVGLRLGGLDLRLGH